MFSSISYLALSPGILDAPTKLYMDPPATDTLRLCIFQFTDNMDSATVGLLGNTKTSHNPEHCETQKSHTAEGPLEAKGAIRRGVRNGNVVLFPGALMERHTYSTV
jgi:hypothetical protein